jgi:hypothetical protein
LAGAESEIQITGLRPPIPAAAAASDSATIPGASLLMNSMLYRDEGLPAVVAV